ncbi:hypothetical protein ACFE04_001571 [Oxalis oulophora]
MGSTYLSPTSSSKRKMPDPNLSTNGAVNNKRSKQQSNQITFRLLCHASRVGGVIGKSGSVIKSLQQSTNAKIRIEDAPAECSDRVITVNAPSVVNGRIEVVEGSEIEVSKAQEALVRVFERILEVAMESNGVAVGAGVVSCRLLIESGQVGSVIGKGGKIVEMIRKECGCKIRVLNDEKLPPCAATNDQVVEIEGDVVAVKKGLIAVSRQLQDSPAADNTKVVRPVETPPQVIVQKPSQVIPQDIIKRYYGVVPPQTLRTPLDVVPQATLRRPLETVTHETFPNLPTDYLSYRNNVPSYVPSSTVIYTSGINHMSLESERFQTLDTKSVQQQEVTFKILCGIDRVGGIIGKGGGIIKTLQNETGASISIGNSVSECDDRLITITASEVGLPIFRWVWIWSTHTDPLRDALKPPLQFQDTPPFLNPESQYSPAQKATILVFSRIIETGFEKGLEAGSSKGSSVTARLVVPSNVIGCLLGKGGTIISEMRKLTGTSIHITGGDQAPKCVSDKEQITGEFSKAKDAVYRVTAKLRDNLFSNVPISAGMRNSSSISSDASPYGRSWDPSALALRQSIGVPHSVSQSSTLTRSMDQRGFSHGLNQHGLSHGLDQHGLSHGMDQHGISSHGMDQGGLSSHGMDQRGMDQRGLSSHRMDQRGLSSQVMDQRGLSSHGMDQRGLSSHGMDQRGLSSHGMDQRDLSSHGMDQRGLSSHGMDQRGLSSHGMDQRDLSSHGMDQRDLSSHGMDQRGLSSHGMDQRGLSSHGMDQSELSHGMDQYGLSHGLDQRGLSHGMDQRGISHSMDQHGLSHGMDQRGLSHGLDQRAVSHGLDLDQRGFSHNLDQHRLSHNLDQYGFSHGLDQRVPPHGLDQRGPSHGLDQHGLSHGLDQPLSPPRLWASQTLTGVNLRDIADIGRGASSFKGGSELGSTEGRTAIVTNTTVEIKVPESVIGCVYGENGNNLARLRQISGAKVIVHQPRYGSSDRIIVISGTPDETQAAQSLLQAFILTGPSS